MKSILITEKEESPREDTLKTERKTELNKDLAHERIQGTSANLRTLGSNEVQSKDFLKELDLDLIPKIADLEAEATNWIVPDWIVEGEYHLITGEPGAMKSMLALHMGHRISVGETLFDRPTVQKKVLYIDKENSAGLIKERQPLLRIFDESNLHYWGSWIGSIPPLHAKSYLELAEKYQPVMIFDSLVRFSFGDENKASDMKHISGWFRAMCNAGATVIVLHHRGKGSEWGSSQYRGSSEILAGCDIAFSISKDARKDEQNPTLDINCFKNRHGPELQHRLTFDSNIGSFVPTLTKKELNQQEDQKEKERLARIIEKRPGITFDELQEQTEIKAKELRELLKNGDDVYWTHESGPSNKFLYHPLTDKVEVSRVN